MPPLMPVLALRRDPEHSWQLETSLSCSSWVEASDTPREFSSVGAGGGHHVGCEHSCVQLLNFSGVSVPHSVNYALGLAVVWDVCSTSGWDSLPCLVRNRLETEGQSTIWSVPICHFQKDLKFLKLCFQGHLSHFETTFCVITKAVIWKMARSQCC